MNPAYGELAQRIRDELAQLESVAQRARSSWVHARSRSESATAYLDSVALAANRPAVVGPNTVAGLDGLRRFRHLVRNAYAVDFDPERVGVLMEGLAGSWASVKAELDAFAGFLETVGDEP